MTAAGTKLHLLLKPLEMNMDITRNIYEDRSNNCMIAAIQKIATYTVIPIALVAAFESLVKNLIVINILNAGITLANQVYSKFYEEKQIDLLTQTGSS